MSKIMKLTAEQISKMEVYREKWIKIGLSTEPTNKDRATKNVSEYYKAGGLQPPKTVIFAASPMEAVVIVNVLTNDKFYEKLQKELKKASSKKEKLSNISLSAVQAIFYGVVGVLNVADTNGEIYTAVHNAVVSVSNEKLNWVSNYVGGNLWAGWQAFYEFFDNELEIPGLEKIRPTCALSQDVGWIFPYEHLCVLVEKPATLNLDTAGRLHNNNGKSISWGDGWGLYTLNGVSVPAWAIETPKDEIDPKKILALTNTEQRMALMRHVGLTKFLKELKAEKIDSMPHPTVKDNKYELYLLTAEGTKIGPYLYMKCPSSGREFLEGCGDTAKYENIDTSIKTCEDALKWRAKQASNQLMTKFNLKWNYVS